MSKGDLDSWSDMKRKRVPETREKDRRKWVSERNLGISLCFALSLTPRFLSLLLFFFFFGFWFLFFRVFIRVWLWWRRGASVKCEREFGFNWEYLYYWAALQTFWTLFRAHLSIHNIHIWVKLILPSFFFFFLTKYIRFDYNFYHTCKNFRKLKADNKLSKLL